MTSPLTRMARLRRVDVGKVALGLYTAVFLFAVVAPIALVVVASFAPTAFVTFPIKNLSWRWYERVFEYQPFMSSLRMSVLVAVLSSLLGALVAVPAALPLARSRRPAAAILVGFLLSPISIPGIVVGFSLLYFLAFLSIGPGLLSLLVAHSIVAIPYILRTALSVYRTMSPDTEDAAIMLGATRWQVLLHVTLPQMRAGIFAGMLFAFLISLDNLPVSFFFGTATTSTLPVVMMSYLQNQFDPSVAAVATIQMLLAVAALVTVDRVYGIGRLTSA